MRTLGASRRQVLVSIVIEALVIGTLAAVTGLFLGLALAKGLFRLFDAVGFTLPNSGIVFGTSTIVIALAAGIIVTLIASLRPALRATRVPPIAAVREGRDFAGRALPPVPHARLGAHHGARLRCARLRPVQAGPRDDRCPGRDGRRRALDLHRRLDALRAVHRAARLGARVAGDPRGWGGGRARARQRPSQPAAHGVDRRCPDDRTRSRHPRRGARRRDHYDLPRCGEQHLAERGLRDHRAEQLLADPADRRRRSGEEPDRRSGRKRAHR